MVKIRLMRVGRKHDPTYRIVAVDDRVKRDGKYIALVGNVNPSLEKDKYKVYEEVALQWLNNGAQPTDTVRSIFREIGLWKKFTESKQKPKKDSKKQTKKK